MVSDREEQLILCCSVYTLMPRYSSCITQVSIGCYIGTVYVGPLAYADDVALLAPTPNAMRRLLSICENYGGEFSVIFKASKCVCMDVCH